jgi:hypothetical protein
VTALAAPVIPPPAPAIVTQAQSGRTYRLARGGEVALRLSGRWGWAEPDPSVPGVELTPVMYFRDPGYSEWLFEPTVRGRVTIRSVGTPGCTGCGLAVRRFVVTFVVG